MENHYARVGLQNVRAFRITERLRGFFEAGYLGAFFAAGSPTISSLTGAIPVFWMPIFPAAARDKSMTRPACVGRDH